MPAAIDLESENNIGVFGGFATALTYNRCYAAAAPPVAFSPQEFRKFKCLAIEKLTHNVNKCDPLTAPRHQNSALCSLLLRPSTREVPARSLPCIPQVPNWIG